MKRQITNEGIIFETEEVTYSILLNEGNIKIKENYNKPGYEYYTNEFIFEYVEDTFENLLSDITESTYNISDLDDIIEIVTELIEDYNLNQI